MKTPKFPLRYWVYISLMTLMLVLFLANILLTDRMTGDKPFHDYAQSDWLLFAVFITSELLFLFLMVFFGIRSEKFMQKHKASFYERSRHDGINPDDYTHIWFDFEGSKRAKILKQGTAFLLYVEAWNDKFEAWESVNTVSCLDSIDAVKKSLYEDFEFYCKENESE